MEYRTHQCGKITEQIIGEKVTITGWVQKRRDLGGLIFIDLRDRSGVVQIVFSPEVSAEALETAEKVRSEYVLTVTGTVIERDQVQLTKLWLRVRSKSLVKTLKY